MKTNTKTLLEGLTSNETANLTREVKETLDKPGHKGNPKFTIVDLWKIYRKSDIIRLGRIDLSGK